MSKLCIEAGKYYRTRDGQKVGPITRGEVDTKSRHWLADGDFPNRASRAWHEDGAFWPVGSPYRDNKNAGYDLIAEWSDLDLTTITTPFGLLDAETQEALKAHGGPYEFWPSYSDDWGIAPNDTDCWINRMIYRVKPAPPKPRERWAYGAHMHDTLESAEKFRGDVDRANPGKGYLDEPITRWVEVLP